MLPQNFKIWKKIQLSIMTESYDSKQVQDTVSITIIKHCKKQIFHKLVGLIANYSSDINR